MFDVFVNLKRFDVSAEYDGICPLRDPAEWATQVIDGSVRLGLGNMIDARLVYFMPEAMLVPTRTRLATHPAGQTRSIAIGVQGVFRGDTEQGGNFGAFTTNLPAAAARNLGATWAIIGHSEERLDKVGLIAEYDPSVNSDRSARERATICVDRVLNQEAHRALDRSLNVVFCVGETAEERGEGPLSEQKHRIEATIRRQVRLGLEGLRAHVDAGREIVIGYEPRWAIGPGKTPPDGAYIGYAADLVQQACREMHGFSPRVIYGGGLKTGNAAEVAAATCVSGGLVALTKFDPPIGFSPEGLAEIVEVYRSGHESAV